MSVALATAKSDQSGVYEREDLLNGCQAVAQGVCLADVDVIAAYPIRPYTEVMDALSKLIADGKFDAEYIIADSEHSQFEIVKHASSVDARAFGGSAAAPAGCTAMEALVVTATDRLPPAFRGRQPRAGRSRRFRRRAQRRAGRSATWAGCSAGSRRRRRRSSTC